MDVKVFSVYLLCGFILVPFVRCRIKDYYYININMTWTDAQQYCRDKDTDLATVESTDDLNRINVPNGVDAWIGLFNDPASWRGVMTSDPNSWRWSATGTTSTSQYQNWAEGEPDSNDVGETCVFMQNQTWKDYLCTRKEYFVCYTVQSGAKVFVLVNISLSWAECQTYCRLHYLDLAMIENSAENQAVLDVMGDTGTVWIGLYREPWRWSDNSNNNFRNWAAGEPNNLGLNQSCAVQNSDRLWFDSSCADLKPFVCYKEKKTSTSKIKIKLQSGADLTDPAVIDQILQQLKERLDKHNTGADFKLKWSMPPTKQEKKPKKKQDVCSDV